MALSRKDFSFVVDESRKLVAADPEDTEAQALLVWIAASAGEGPDTAVRAALGALDRLITSDSDCWRAYFYRGMLHKRLADAVGAHRDFARVLQLQPENVDAAREVRTYEMGRPR